MCVLVCVGELICCEVFWLLGMGVVLCEGCECVGSVRVCLLYLSLKLSTN